MLSDQQARLNAIDPTKSFIVQAPAGSGKTSLLVSRFINLVKNCKNPEECLAITFTKKAAFEMRHRVLTTLNNLIAKEEYSSNHIYSRIVVNPNRLQILTIDAFCAQLIQKMPLLSRIGSNFTITEDPELLYQQAVEQLLEILELPNNYEYTKGSKEYQDLIKLYKYFSNNHELINDLLKNLLANREQWLPLIVPIGLSHNDPNSKVIPKKIRLFLEKNLQIVVNQILSEISKSLPPLEIQTQILLLAKYAANNIEDPEQTLFKLKDLGQNWPSANYLNLSIWQGIASLLLNKDGSPRVIVNSKQGFLSASKIKDPAAKKLAAELKSEMQSLLKFLQARHTKFLFQLSQINDLPAVEYQEDNWEILSTLFSLLPKLAAYLMLVFQENQQVDFTQVAIAALQAITADHNSNDLALILDYQLKHILVDEFQDTSILQYKLIERLISNWENDDNRTIFMVGDPMQSIYSFRQANVSLFLQVQQFGIGNLKLQKLFLTTNFRSSASIVNNLNNLFTKIFPVENDINSGGVKYSSSLVNKIINNQSTLCHLDLYKIDNDVQFIITKDVEHEAKEIIKVIQRIQTVDPNLQIAILFRTRSHAINIIKQLQANNIQYQSNELGSLTSKSVILDLYVLLRAVLHPNDLIAWLSLLRGPLVGLKLVDLNTLFEGQTNKPLFNKLINYKENTQLSIDAIYRLNYVIPILVDAINFRENINLPSLIKKIWIKLGGNLIYDQKSLNFLELFLVDLSRLPDPYDLAKIERLINNNVTLNDQNIDPKSVHLMTIHKAKGLEFDIVISPSMDKAGRNSQNSLLLWEERTYQSKDPKNLALNCLENYLLFAPIRSRSQQDNSIYDFIKLSKEQKELHETKRLLYVAMSRAKKKFYGFVTSKSYASKSFFKFLQPYVKAEQLINLEQNLDPAKLETINNFLENSEHILLYRLPTEWYINK